MSIGKSKILYSLLAAILMSMNEAALASVTNSFQKIQSEVNKYTSNLPFVMPKLELPEIPDTVFNIVNYGAVGDGQSLNTKAFREAIETCSRSGGGIVLVPPGLWLTGPIRLESKVNFHVSRGALILFSKNHEDYPIVKSPTRGFVVASPVYGFNLNHVAITGNGVLDGSGVTWRPVKKSKVTASMWKTFLQSGGVVTDGGKIWWPTKEAAEGEQYLKNLKEKKNRLTASDLLPARDYMRPMELFLSKCRNVLIDGVTFMNSPKFAVYPDRCEDVVIRDVKINNEYWAQNGDGIDMSSSKNVLIYKCTVTAGDDGICMKSSRDKSGNAALKNVVIEDCVVYHAHGGFVIGSNTDGGMENVSVKNCDYIGTDIGLRFKSARGRGGVVKNIYIRDIYMKDIVKQAILFNTYYEESIRSAKPLQVTERTPVFKNFHIDGIYCDGASEAVRIDGLPEMPIQGITISNAVIVADRGFVSSFAFGIDLNNVKIIPRSGNVYSLNDMNGFKLNGGYCPSGTGVFLSVAGKGTEDVRILNTDLSSARTPVFYGPEVNKNSVVLKQLLKGYK